MDDEDPRLAAGRQRTDPNAGADPNEPNAPDGNAVVVAPQDGDDGGDGADAGVDAGAVVFDGATQEQWVDRTSC